MTQQIPTFKDPNDWWIGNKRALLRILRGPETAYNEFYDGFPKGKP